MSETVDTHNFRRKVERAAELVGDVFYIIAETVLVRLSDVILIVTLMIAQIGFGYATIKMIWAEAWDLKAVVDNPMGYIVEDVAVTFTIKLLSLADEILLAGILVLVIRGTMQVYVSEVKASRLTGKPWPAVSAFKNLSGGTLKEKVISTVATASAIFLFKVMLMNGPRPGVGITWVMIGLLVLLHLMFLFGNVILAYFNNKHDAAAHAVEEPHGTPEPPHGESAHDEHATPVVHDDPAPAESHPHHDVPRAA